MTLAVALDLPNQTLNLSLGLCDSTEALYARSLQEGFAEAPTQAFSDTWHYNQGVAIKDTLAGSSARLGTAYNGKQQRLAKAVAFTKGVGGFSLGADFDFSELTLAQSIQSFFNLAPLAFRFQAELFTTASVDSDAGNNGNFLGSWTSVNPDVDVQEQTPGGIVNVGWTTTGEWLQWNRPAPMIDGTYAVSLNLSRGAGVPCSGDVNGSSFSTPDTGDWAVFQERTNLCTVVVTPATTSIRLTFNQGFNLDWLQLTRI